MKWRTVRPLRFIGADIENMPGTYGPGDYTHPKVTAIGWQEDRDPRAYGRCLNRRNPEQCKEIAEEFRVFWDRSDFVVGHNFRRHDRKILDGLYTSLDLPLLEPKRIVDTYLDQPKMAGLSRSLENLAARWGCPIQKLHLTEYDWERAYDGIPEAVALMKDRVTSDVSINLWLFRELVRRGLLRVP